MPIGPCQESAAHSSYGTFHEQRSPIMTRYVVISPVRDEEGFITNTLECAIRQTVLPAEWVIVDDGSSDGTPAILDRYAAQYPWIRIIHRPNRGFRKSGGGVMEAFYDGYNALQCTDWEFVVKLDGDLSFTPEYFERCFEHFRNEPKLGIGGGEVYHDIEGQLKLESNPIFHVRGATKIYRKACWEAIGGLWKAAGWDTIDEVKANMLGWKTYSFTELPLEHHRVTGMADGLVRDRVKHGQVCYVSGYHPLFVMASCMYRIAKRPYLIGSAAILYGYLKACLSHPPRVEDPSYVAYIRDQQMKRLLGQQTIWK